MATQLTPTKTPVVTVSAEATGPGPVRRALHRIRATLEEMNYATRRLVELQTTGR
jgi:hypothetical protein